MYDNNPYHGYPVQHWGQYPCYPGYQYPTAPTQTHGHHYYPMIEQAMEAQYPEVYHRVRPVIVRTCDTMDNMTMYPIPSREVVEGMVDVAYKECATLVPVREDIGESEDRQFYTGRRLFRDLIGILLIGELLRRRRRRYYYY